MISIGIVIGFGFGICISNIGLFGNIGLLNIGLVQTLMSSFQLHIEMINFFHHLDEYHFTINVESNHSMFKMFPLYHF